MWKETAFWKWYRRSIFKRIPEYGLISAAACFLLNCSVYWGTQLLMGSAHHYDLTTALDRQIPFLKEWSVIYLLSFVFWAVNFILVSFEEKEKWFRFVTSDMTAKLICAAVFILLPTTNVRPQVPGADLFSWLTRFIFQSDRPTNLFPSIHCLVSWLCFIGIRRSKKIPLWYKGFSCLFALLICASTQLIKQHYLADVAGGILLAELCYALANHTRLYLGVQTFFERIGRKIFGGEPL